MVLNVIKDFSLSYAAVSTSKPVLLYLFQISSSIAPARKLQCFDYKTGSRFPTFKKLVVIASMFLNKWIRFLTFVTCVGIKKKP